LDIFWLKDQSLEDSANLPNPDLIAAEIAEDLEAALDQFSQFAADLGGDEDISAGFCDYIIAACRKSSAKKM